MSSCIFSPKEGKHFERIFRLRSPATCGSSANVIARSHCRILPIPQRGEALKNLRRTRSRAFVYAIILVLLISRYNPHCPPSRSRFHAPEAVIVIFSHTSYPRRGAFASSCVSCVYISRVYLVNILICKCDGVSLTPATPRRVIAVRARPTPQRIIALPRY